MTARTTTNDDRNQTAREFGKMVNMTPAALRKWLTSEDSRSVGMTKAGEKVSSSTQQESVGHHMGERIVEIKSLKPSELTEDDYRDMRKVVGYIHRHIKQRPDGDICDSRWRRSLMNWGHDPLKD